MNAEDSRMAASAICFAADMMKEIFREAVSIWGSPGTVYRPRLYLDGDRWCALYGENLQEGVAGFGMSPAEAMAAFDVAWFEECYRKTLASCMAYGLLQPRAVSSSSTDSISAAKPTIRRIPAGSKTVIRTSP